MSETGAKIQMVRPVAAKRTQTAETSSTVSDEKSSQSSQDIPDVKGQPTTWALFAQSLFQVRGSHSYCCAVLPNPLLPKKEKGDHLASLASWVTILRIMGDLPDSEYGDNIELAGTTPPVIACVKQNFHRKYGKKDVDEAQKKYTELFKDPAHAEVKDIPFLPSNSASMLDKVQYVCGLGIYRPEIRDELYCQVCKQLTNNPSRNSTVRGWVLLLMFAGSFSPTERFSPCFLQFLRDSPPVFASRVEKLLRRTFIVGTRGYPPSWLEFQAAKNGKPILIPVALMNNHRMLVNSDSATTVQEICRQIAHRTNLKDPAGFSIYITLQQKAS
ncbi:hypothetical protein FSP39_014238 [Pinctada imbricata]|uniref:MyTH4 domain-containing protein n=1 Tax=Pinctada imbricata TaxID=66713 RepID=A0AA88Y0F7_PINIB|nr:hypothetical protein FSP39_014238 [Pinctada imbricata]